MMMTCHSDRMPRRSKASTPRPRAGGTALLWLTVIFFSSTAPAMPQAAAAPAPPPTAPGASCPIPGKLTAADGSLRGFVPATHFYLELDGKETPAELYNIGTSAILVISSKLATPILLKAFTVAAVPLGNLERHPDGTLDIRPDATLRPLGPYRSAGDSVTFKVGGHGEALRLRPPLDFLRAPASPPSDHPQ